MIYGLIIAFLIADRMLKNLSAAFLVGENISVVQGVLSLTYVENRGAAFGIMQNATWFFVIVTVLVIAGLVAYTVVKKPDGNLFKWASVFVFSGAVGNLIDRVAYGYVIDMIKVDFFDFPVFNFADCCVVVGAVLFGFYILKSDKKTPEK